MVKAMCKIAYFSLLTTVGESEKTNKPLNSKSYVNEENFAMVALEKLPP